MATSLKAPLLGTEEGPNSVVSDPESQQHPGESSAVVLLRSSDASDRSEQAKQVVSEEDERMGASTWSSVMNLCSTSVGAGIMALPATVKVLGLPLGFFTVVLMGALTHCSILIIVRTAVATGSRSYGHLMGTKFGRGGRILCHVFVMLQALGSLVVYLIITADVLAGTAVAGEGHHTGVLEELAGGAATWWNSRTSVILAITFFLLVPLVSLPQIDHLMTSSSLSLALAAIFVGFTATAASLRWLTGRLPPLRMWPDLSSLEAMLPIFTVLPVMTNAFICHYNVQPIYEELSRASERRMKRVAVRSQALCTVLYAITCVSAYALFGEATSADVLANYDSDLGLSQAMDDIVRVGYVAHLLLVFPVVHFPLRFTADILFFPSATVPLHRDPVRFAFLTTCTMSLILFLGLLVPDIYALFSFLGALVAVSIGFTFPALLALLTPDLHLTLLERIAVFCMLILGILVSFTGITTDIYVAFRWFYSK